MTWIAEIIVQGFWESAVEVAYHKWGWLGGAVALLGPFAIGGVALWIILDDRRRLKYDGPAYFYVT